MADIKEDVENKIIDCIVLGSGGRLLVTKPEAAATGADLIIKRKGEYKNKKDIVFLKIFDKEKLELASAEGYGVPRENFYLLFADFDIVKQDIEDSIRIIRLNDKKEFLVDKKDLAQFFLKII